MLTALHPEVIPFVEQLRIGLTALSIPGGGPQVLVVKTAKDGILAAKLNRGFKIYVSLIALEGAETVGLVSAFFDDEDEPLCIWTPVFDDELSHALLGMLKRSSLDIYFFDEHNREWLGYVSKIECPAITKGRLSSACLRKFDLDFAQSSLTQMQIWFGRRSKADDLLAVSIEFVKAIFPDDYLIVDTRPDRHSCKGSPHFSFWQLMRDAPGASNERDIAHLLESLFPAKHIYLNPLRITDRKEIADILVITDSDVIVIQAKDSPNTEPSLKRAMNRKRSATRKALSRATDQLQGAIRYLRSISPAKMIVADETFELEMGKRVLHGLIVVKELFNDEYAEYTPPILSLAKETQVPCIVIDYRELQEWVTGLDGEEPFFRAFDRVFSRGIETGQFPRLRVWPSSLFPEATGRTD